jgi:hypothetical protein
VTAIVETIKDQEDWRECRTRHNRLQWLDQIIVALMVGHVVRLGSKSEYRTGICLGNKTVHVHEIMSRLAYQMDKGKIAASVQHVIGLKSASTQNDQWHFEQCSLEKFDVPFRLVDEAGTTIGGEEDVLKFPEIVKHCMEWNPSKGECAWITLLSEEPPPAPVPLSESTRKGDNDDDEDDDDGEEALGEDAVASEEYEFDPTDQPQLSEVEVTDLRKMLEAFHVSQQSDGQLMNVLRNAFRSSNDNNVVCDRLEQLMMEYDESE